MVKQLLSGNLFGGFNTVIYAVSKVATFIEKNVPFFGGIATALHRIVSIVLSLDRKDSLVNRILELVPDLLGHIVYAIL